MHMDLLNRIKQLEKNIEKIDILAKKLAQDNSNKQKRTQRIFNAYSYPGRPR